MTTYTVDIEKAKTNPASQFKHPEDILNYPGLSRELKIFMLRQWAYDEREQEVAEEENMRSANNDHVPVLDEIMRCLLILGVDHEDHSPPTKQG